MPAVLSENQYEISDAASTDGFVFGTEGTGYLTLTRPRLVGGDVRVGDRERPQEDGRMMGRDFRGGKSIEFEIGVLTDTNADPLRANLDHLDALEARWLDTRWRRDPSAFAMLRVREGGQTWRCYGRPRQYDEVVGNLTRQGYSTVLASFDLVDGLFYSDDLELVDTTLSAPTASGLVAPLSTPVTTIPVTASASATMVVTGSRPTWPVVEFHGPVAHPKVTIGGMVVGVNVVIGVGDSVVFDPRPWVRSATRAGGTVSVAGHLHYQTQPMRSCQMSPGVYEVAYEGLDESGSSRCEVSWRHARSRP